MFLWRPGGCPGGAGPGGAVPAVAGAAGRAVRRKHRRPRRRMEPDPERAEAPRRSGVAGVSPASPSWGFQGLGPRCGRGAGVSGPAAVGRRAAEGPGRAEPGGAEQRGRGGPGGGCGAHTCGKRCLCSVRAPRLAAGRGAMHGPALSSAPCKETALASNWVSSAPSCFPLHYRY